MLAMKYKQFWQSSALLVVLLPKTFTTAKGLKVDVKAQYKINAVAAVRRCKIRQKASSIRKKKKNKVSVRPFPFSRKISNF